MAAVNTPGQFDPQRCAELHNDIIRRGWEGSGQDFEDAEFQTWWDRYGEDCDNEGITPRLVPQVIEFLKNALYVDRELKEPDAAYQNFFYYLRDLSLPATILSESFILEGLDEEPPRYVLLYQATDLKSHPCGVIFDQQTLKARTVFSITIDDTIVDERSRPWVPLQNILEAYLEMIELGKITIADSESDSEDEADDGEDKVAMEQTPWTLHPHSNAILERTLDAYKKLLGVIEERVPNSPRGSPPSSPPSKRQRTSSTGSGTGESSSQLASDQITSDLVSSNQAPENSFVIKFLRSAQQPGNKSLKYIAPGIKLPSEQDLSNQPFRDINYLTSNSYNPILIFPGVENEDVASNTTFPDDNHNPFKYPYNQDRSSYPSGLWITESSLDGDSFDDACRLLLPRHAIDRGEGTEHHAKSADGFVLENRDGEGLAAGLYQTSCNPYIPRHEVEVFRVLENWIQLIEQGTWEVDQHGVCGGIEKWAEADQSEDMSARYQVPFTW